MSTFFHGVRWEELHNSSLAINAHAITIVTKRAPKRQGATAVIVKIEDANSKAKAKPFFEFCLTASPMFVDRTGIDYHLSMIVSPEPQAQPQASLLKIIIYTSTLHSASTVVVKNISDKSRQESILVILTRVIASKIAFMCVINACFSL